MKTYTIADIMALRPCNRYNTARVTEIFAGRPALTLLDILDLDIPAEDRVWVATRLLPEREARLFAADCAERALERERASGREPHEASWRAVETARRYARGEATRGELGTAAEDAARAAEDAAARAAAYAAAEDAAYAAEDAAAWAAARAAAAAAAEAAARAAEHERQVARLREYARGEAK